MSSTTPLRRSPRLAEKMCNAPSCSSRIAENACSTPRRSPRLAENACSTPSRRSPRLAENMNGPLRRSARIAGKATLTEPTYEAKTPRVSVNMNMDERLEKFNNYHTNKIRKYYSRFRRQFHATNLINQFNETSTNDVTESQYNDLRFMLSLDHLVEVFPQSRLAQSFNRKTE
jgi:hypothetical protein